MDHSGLIEPTRIINQPEYLTRGSPKSARTRSGGAPHPVMWVSAAPLCRAPARLSMHDPSAGLGVVLDRSSTAAG